MKTIKAALILAAMLAPSVARAEGDICAEIGELAQTIMKGRQSGAVMSEMIAAATRIDGPQPMKDLAVAMIREAFVTPQFSVDENRVEAALQFRNANELACYQAD